MPAAMLLKLQRDKYRETCRTVKEHKTNYACIFEADESTRIRLEGAPERYHEDHIAGKDINSPSRYSLGSQVYSNASSIKKFWMRRLQWKKKG